MGESSLPQRALAWAQNSLDAPIRSVEPVGGGITRTKWVLHLDAGPVTLRWSDPEVWGDLGREHVRREAYATRLLADSSLPLPRLLAVDPDGTLAGGPADLLTWSPGAVRLDPLGPTAVRALAELAVALHRHPVPVDDRPPEFGFRGPGEPRVPPWTAKPALWQHAIDLRFEGAPPTPYGLLHRDFHFGNIVWQGDRVSGLLDWAETSWGPPDLDVAHLCSDFAMMHSAARAEDFRAAYRAAGGTLDPAAARFWQVADILGFLPDPAHILPGLRHLRPDLTAERVRAGLEDLLEQTIASF